MRSSRKPFGHSFEPTSRVNVRSVLSDKYPGEGKATSSDLVEYCCAGALQDVEKLLASGVAPHAEDSCGEPAICSATLGGHSQVVSLLLSYGASVLQCTTFKETPLHLAARIGSMDCTQVLLQHARSKNQTADILEAKNYMGADCLHVASEKGHAAICKLLVEEGAVLTSEDHSGRQPLQLAVYWGHDEVVRELLKLGADPREKGGCGESALDMAENGSHTELRLVLMSHLLKAAEEKTLSFKQEASQEREEKRREREAYERAESERLELHALCTKNREKMNVLEQRVRELEAENKSCNLELLSMKQSRESAVQSARAAVEASEDIEVQLENTCKEHAKTQHALEAMRAVAAKLTVDLDTEKENSASLEANIERLEGKWQKEQQLCLDSNSRVDELETAALEAYTREQTLQRQVAEIQEAYSAETERRVMWESTSEHLEERVKVANATQEELKQRFATVVQESAKLWQQQLGAMHAVLGQESTAS